MLFRSGGMLTTAFNARLIRCGRFNKGDIRQGVAIRHIVIIKIKRFYKHNIMRYSVCDIAYAMSICYKHIVSENSTQKMFDILCLYNNKVVNLRC